MNSLFTEKMVSKTTMELQQIVDNKNDYEIDAYLAAFKELKKRKEQQAPAERPLEIVDNTEEVNESHGTKQSFSDTMALLIPGRQNLITPIIVGLNVLIFIVMIIGGVGVMEPSVDHLIGWGGNLRGLTINNEQWRLLSSTFLHAGLVHLLLNMYALLNIGYLLETNFGRRKYVILYFATGIMASIASIMTYENIVSVGASGAIFGMYGLLLSLAVTKTIIIPKETRSQLIYSIVFFIGYNLLYGITQEGIDNAAHAGGLISGFVFGALYYLVKESQQRAKVLSVSILLLVVAIAVSTPAFISSHLAAYDKMITRFSINEEKALWMYQEEMNYNNEAEAQTYYDRMRTEGIDLWKQNIDLLSSLTDLPEVQQEQVKLLNKYCQLRLESCEIMQSLIHTDTQAKRQQLEDVSSQIEHVLNQLEELAE